MRGGWNVEWATGFLCTTRAHTHVSDNASKIIFQPRHSCRQTTLRPQPQYIFTYSRENQTQAERARTQNRGITIINQHLCYSTVDGFYFTSSAVLFCFLSCFSSPLGWLVAQYLSPFSHFVCRAIAILYSIRRKSSELKYEAK